MRRTPPGRCAADPGRAGAGARSPMAWARLLLGGDPGPARLFIVPGGRGGSLRWVAGHGRGLAAAWPRYGDRAGRRRCYVIMYVLLAIVGVVFAVRGGRLWALLGGQPDRGTVDRGGSSPGPFHVPGGSRMLAAGLPGRGRAGPPGSASINAVATVPPGRPGRWAARSARGLARHWWPAAPADGPVLPGVRPGRPGRCRGRVPAVPGGSRTAAPSASWPRRRAVPWSGPGRWCTGLCALFAVDSPRRAGS